MIEALVAASPPRTASSGAVSRPASAASTIELAHAVGGHVVTPRRPFDPELIDAVVAGKDECVHVSESMQYLGHHRRQPGIRNPEELMAHPGGVGERTEHVEHGADAELASHRPTCRSAG